jgi:hypothetical protein
MGRRRVRRLPVDVRLLLRVAVVTVHVTVVVVAPVAKLAPPVEDAALCVCVCDARWQQAWMGVPAAAAAGGVAGRCLARADTLRKRAHQLPCTTSHRQQPSQHAGTPSLLDLRLPDVSLTSATSSAHFTLCSARQHTAGMCVRLNVSDAPPGRSSAVTLHTAHVVTDGAVAHTHACTQLPAAHTTHLFLTPGHEPQRDRLCYR